MGAFQVVNLRKSRTVIRQLVFALFFPCPAIRNILVHTSKISSRSSFFKHGYFFKMFSFWCMYVSLAKFQFGSSRIWKIAAPIDR